jgi:hypothetical protein
MLKMFGVFVKMYLMNIKYPKALLIMPLNSKNSFLKKALTGLETTLFCNFLISILK